MFAVIPPSLLPSENFGTVSSEKEELMLQVLRLPGCLYPFGVCCHGADRVVVSDLHGGLHVLASRRLHV